MSIKPVINFCKKNFKREINVIEIGARYGDSSEVIMKNLNVSNYYIIDPYESYEEYSIDGFNEVLKKNKNIFENTKKKLNNMFSRVNITFYKNYSNDKNIINNFENESIDLIFIDGNHEYSYVLSDLENYYPKLKKNGIICGDDFFMRHYENDFKRSLPLGEYPVKMVYEAVTEFKKKYNLKLLTFGNHRNYPSTYAFIKPL